jgi:hypothetical protein
MLRSAEKSCPIASCDKQSSDRANPLSLVGRAAVTPRKVVEVRIPGFAIVLLVTGASAWWSQGPRADVAVILDVDAPLADPENSTQLRERALADVERNGHPVYFELTAGAIRSVPDEARESFRSSKLPIPSPPAYNGVSLSFPEAAEILRKNEAVRDTVIRRACPTSGDCGAAVHAAALALTRDTEVASATKLQHLASLARQQPATTLVLVTAGWPYRDEESLRLDAIVRDLRAGGTKLTVLRVPASIAYGRLVKDASERITSQLAGTFIALKDDEGAERARRMLSARLRTAVKTPAQPPPTPSEAPAVRDDAVVSTPPDVLDEPLRRAADYVARFEDTVSAVIWRERYHQEDRLPRKFNSSGTTFSTIAAQRKLDSDLLLVWLPREASWIAVRDVIAIDDTPRSSAERRLQALMSSQTVQVDQLKKLAAENGRFNIGRIVRSFNEPTLALLFLDGHYRHRFSFAPGGEQTLDGTRVVRYEFIERARPTVIRNSNRDVPTRGTLWIDPVSGRILLTSLRVTDPGTRLQGRMTVHYWPAPRFEVLVPLEMREWYTSPDGEEITTLASYSDFRRFETGGRLIVPQ